MRYFANAAHKTSTSEAGPPRWRPNKSRCPSMTIAERDQLLAESVEDEAKAGRVRYALRTGRGGFEWFAARGQEVDGELEYHGYPCDHVPIRVLRRFRDLARITAAQYEKFRKELP